MDFCKKSFKTQSQLNDHEKDIHFKLKYFYFLFLDLLIVPIVIKAFQDVLP